MTQPLFIALIAKNYLKNYHPSLQMSREDATISQEIGALDKGVKSLFLTLCIPHLEKQLNFKDKDLTPYFARYASSNLSILGPQRSPLQSPLPDPRSLFISCSEVAPFFIAPMKRFREIPLQIQIVSFCSSHSLLRSSESIWSVFLLPCFFEVRDKKCQG